MSNIDSIKLFSEKRNILFSTFHRDGADTALQYLEGYKKVLGAKNYAGLKGEINFYKGFRKDYQLVVGADNGDHTDFCGTLDGEIIRFDVTTNASYKKLKDYEPLQRQLGARYKIVVMKDNGDVDEILDINFPFCEYCEKGRIMDIAFLLSDNYNNKGENLWSNDQILVGACHECGFAYEKERITTSGLTDFATEIDNAIEASRSSILEENEILIDKNQIILAHTYSTLPYLHRQFDTPILAMGQGKYDLHGTDGEGEYIAEIIWRDHHTMFKPYILDAYDFNPNSL